MELSGKHFATGKKGKEEDYVKREGKLYLDIGPNGQTRNQGKD
jgi:hypothetical protein